MLKYKKTLRTQFSIDLVQFIIVRELKVVRDRI